MAFKEALIRHIAAGIFFLKRQEFRKKNLKFLVFTGTVGKTTGRDVLVFFLKKAGYSVVSYDGGYTNELGIVLSALNVRNFSFFKFSTWKAIWQSKIDSERFVGIELGADFRRDISWFLRRFQPFAVFITAIAPDPWAGNITEIKNERHKLIEKIPAEGCLVFSADDPAAQDLVRESRVLCPIISYSLEKKPVAVQVALPEKINWNQERFFREQRPEIRIGIDRQKVSLNPCRFLFRPQIEALAAAFGFCDKAMGIAPEILTAALSDYSFSKDRLQIFKAANGMAVIEDSYKATPCCMNWFLEMAAAGKARRKIVVLTELRPLDWNIVGHYQQIAAKLTFTSEVYFLGPLRIFRILAEKQPGIVHIAQEDYPQIARTILRSCGSGDVIFLKGSFRYELSLLRKLLCGEFSPRQ